MSEARDVLDLLGFPPPQRNERSALVLLALLNLRDQQPWASGSRDQLLRTVDIIAFIRDHYGKSYKPNSRETIRRQTLHQFVDAGLILRNPDDPNRPVNSGSNCYQLSEDALSLLRTRDAPGFPDRVAGYLTAHTGLVEKYARSRGLVLTPVQLPDGAEVLLTPGGQNTLIRAILESFCPRWTPGGRVLYVGDAGPGEPVFDAESLAELGLNLDKHGKLPDLIVHVPARGWLVLIEAASSHGPVDAKRRDDLTVLFSACPAEVLFVSCFASRAAMRPFVADLAWETEAWCADAPEHLIHFNGERFLTPSAE